MTPSSQPAAVLWDFDGTMVDSEPIWSGIQADMLAQRGVVWGPERMVQLVGLNAELTSREMAAAIGGDTRSEDLLVEMEERVAAALVGGLPWLPGARELLDEISAAGVPSAIVTASSRRIMDGVVAHLPENFEFLITADDVRVTKPNPECYLEAARRLGARPQDCLVLEDSVPGAHAALTAGAVVYAVPALAELQPHPRMRVSATGLQETSWAELVEHWNGSRTW